MIYPGGLRTDTTPKGWLAGSRIAEDYWPPSASMNPRAVVPPTLAVRPELTEADVGWLNAQLDLCGRASVRYARQVPTQPPPPTGWITTTLVKM